MVNLELVAATKNFLGTRTRKILVTGATGFVGRNVAALLNAAGQDVTATGRNRYLAPPDIRFVKTDIRDRNQTIELCRGQETVIHCASNTAIWGSYSQLASTNIQGTENILAGCQQQGVSRLIHVSSTSIHFNFRDQLGISEDDDLPKTFSCNYAATKWAAEKLVQNACDQGLNGFIIRARAVFGPGDQNLMPRLLEVYDQGRLRQIGNGQNITELTYIDNLIHALVLAIDRGQSGQTCTVTGEEPILLWDLVRKILKETGRNDELKSVPYWLARSLAGISETGHRIVRSPKEPALTRYSVGLLAKSQTFKTDAARRELDYKPIVSLKCGIDRTIGSFNRKVSDHSSTPVKIQLFTTGYTRKSLHLAEHKAMRKPVAFHAMFALIEHPKNGLTLFDTGYAPRIHEATARWPYRAYTMLTPVKTSPELTCKHWLESKGIDPAQIRRIVVSHFHADHIGGLRDFPNSEIIASKESWNAVVGKSGVAALKRAFLPSLLPDDIRERLCLLPSFNGPGMGPFRVTHDLFFDGSVRLIALPGHANGQIGALIQSGEKERMFLIADATWTRRTIHEKLPPTFAFRAIAENSRQAIQSLQKLTTFHDQFPDIQLVPTHCREIAKEQGFDDLFEELAEEHV